MSVFLGWMPAQDQWPAFVALRDQVADALPADAHRHSWRAPQQWHMTLFHLGDELAADRQVELEAGIARLAAHTHALSTQFDGLRYWPGASVLVARIVNTPSLGVLFSDIVHAASTLGFTPDKRKPQPHVTLAYLPRGSRPTALPAPQMLARTPLRIDRIQLLRTARGGYDVLAEWPLLPGDAA